jgi:type VI secretion system secreted protein VgrG
MEAVTPRFRSIAWLPGTLIIALALALALSGTAHALATPVPEGTARNFAVLAGETITNTNATTITGDIGLHPGTSITGYGPGADQITHTGEVHAANAVASDAKDALTTAYNDAAAQTVDSTIATDLVGQNLTEGVYDSASGTFENSGVLTLTGDADSIFIFQMESTLITGSGSTVVLDGDISPCHIYWQVGSSATLGSGSQLAGTVMANTSITMDSASTLEGRLWARTGAVSLNNNTISNPCFTAGATGTGTGFPTATDDQVESAPTGGVATGDGSTLTAP